MYVCPLLWTIAIVFCLSNTAVSTSETATHLIPCKQGWFLYGRKCYKIIRKADGLNWKQAAVACTLERGKLATIHSKGLQDFLVMFLLLQARRNGWIGLHDQEKESEFRWTDGSPLNYTNWDRNQPSGKGGVIYGDENCVELRIEYPRGKIGTWNDESCNSERSFFCEVDERAEESSRDPRFCSVEEGGGWKYMNSCYHVVTEAKSWEDAEYHCEETFGGHLVTILDEETDAFLNYLFPNYTKNFWIGTKMRDLDIQLWSSGWHVIYSNWDHDPTHFLAGTCGMMSKEIRWTVGPCLRQLPFICEISKHKAPALKKSPKDWRCPGVRKGWMDLQGDHCYFFESNRSVTWHEADCECGRRGGDLASIHSEAEAYVLHPYVKNKQSALFIGYHRSSSNKHVFEWTDGSPFDYRNWAAGEPNNLTEECGEVWTETMVWNDVRCERTRGYICSAKKVPPNNTAEMNTTACHECVCTNPRVRSPDLRYCSHGGSGGFRFHRSCYYPVMQTKTWEEAEQHCVQHYGGHLVTVLDMAVEFFLKYLLPGVQSEIWIGIKIREDSIQQKWSSGWYVGYNGFSKRIQPFVEGDCVLRTQRKEWNIIPCSNKYAFICEKSDVIAPVRKLPVKDSYCPTTPEGWRDLDGEFCYFFETENTVSWHEANYQCMRRGGNLLSMHSKEQSDILHTFIQYAGPAAFIGLLRQQEQGEAFRWTDGSVLDFVNWEPGEPNDENEKCVEARPVNMKWNDVKCDEKRAYICAVKKITPNMTITSTETVNYGCNCDCDCSGNILKTALIGSAVSILLLILLLGVAIYSFCRKNAEGKKEPSAVNCRRPASAAVPHKYRSYQIRADEQDSYYEAMDM